MSWAELLAAADEIRNAVDLREAELRERQHAGPSPSELAIVGVGWATVDAARAIEELATILGVATWVEVERDALLGASAWRRDPPPDPGSGVELLVMEPDTEGRLAAFLARSGEGVGVVYLSSSGGDPVRVLPVNPRWGPYAIVRSRVG